METKHTQGEWYNGSLDGKIRDGKQGIICERVKGIKTDQEYQANAKLIAEAPELLEALEKIKNSIKNQSLEVRFGPTFIRVEQAIKKATS